MKRFAFPLALTLFFLPTIIFSADIEFANNRIPDTHYFLQGKVQMLGHISHVPNEHAAYWINVLRNGKKLKSFNVVSLNSGGFS